MRAALAILSHIPEPESYTFPSARTLNLSTKRQSHHALSCDELVLTAPKVVVHERHLHVSPRNRPNELHDPAEASGRSASGGYALPVCILEIIKERYTIIDTCPDLRATEPRGHSERLCWFVSRKLFTELG